MNTELKTAHQIQDKLTFLPLTKRQGSHGCLERRMIECDVSPEWKFVLSEGLSHDFTGRQLITSEQSRFTINRFPVHDSDAPSHQSLNCL